MENRPCSPPAHETPPADVIRWCAAAPRLSRQSAVRRDAVPERAFELLYFIRPHCLRPRECRYRAEVITAPDVESSRTQRCVSIPNQRSPSRRNRCIDYPGAKQPREMPAAPEHRARSAGFAKSFRAHSRHLSPSRTLPDIRSSAVARSVMPAAPCR